MYPHYHPPLGPSRTALGGRKPLVCLPGPRHISRAAGEQSKQKAGCALIQGKTLASARCPKIVSQSRPKRLGQESPPPPPPTPPLPRPAQSTGRWTKGFFVPLELPSLAEVINELY